jgi:hypothetical protein
MFNWFNKKKEETKVETPVEEIPVVLISQGEHSEPKKPRKPRVKKEKPAANPKVEPRVDILKFEFDPANPRLGSIELDWNTEFVELLSKHGYVGANEEEIVDKWLNDVCQNIVTNEYEGANVKPSALSAANIVSRKPLGDGKSEIS